MAIGGSTPLGNMAQTILYSSTEDSERRLGGSYSSSLHPPSVLDYPLKYMASTQNHASFTQELSALAMNHRRQRENIIYMDLSKMVHSQKIFGWVTANLRK